MSYLLRNIVIAYIAVLAVVLLILFITYSTLISQEKEQIQISQARNALQKTQPAVTNALELERITSNYSRLPDSSLLIQYQELIPKIRQDSLELAHVAQTVESSKEKYFTLATMTRKMTDQGDLIMTPSPGSRNYQPALHLREIQKFKDLAEEIENQNRIILNNAYSNSIGYTRKTYTFVRVTLIVLVSLLLLSFIFISKDYRHRKRAEKELVAFNASLERQVAEKTNQIIREKDLSDSIINSLPGIFYLQEKDGKFLRWNKELEMISGYSGDEISTMNGLDFFEDGSREKIVDAQQKVFAEGLAHTEAWAIAKNGDRVPFFFMGRRIQHEGQPCLIGTGIDITARKKVERENERIRELLDERIKELTTLYRCSQVLQTEDRPLPELLHEIVDIIPGGWHYPEIAAAKIQLGEASYTTSNYRQGAHHQSARFAAPGGKEGMVEVVYLEPRPAAAEDAFSAEERDLINMLAELIRVSLARRHESEELKKSEANLQTIFDITDTIYFLLDNNFQVISYNQRAVAFCEEQLGKNIKDIQSGFMRHFSPEREPVLSDWLRKASTGDQVMYEQSFNQPDGLQQWYLIRMFPITGSGKKVFGLMLAVSDITEIKISEQEILDREVQDQKKITRAVLQAQEMERNKIGQELHDNVNQILASTKLYLGMAVADNKDEHEYIRHSIGFVQEAIAEIRKLSSREVSPVKGIDLKELVESLIDQIDRRANIHTSFTYDVSAKSLDDDLKLNIYRIVQEEVNNMLKHSKAHHFSISFAEKENSLTVDIRDDGVGFDPANKRNGIGISNVINRVKSYNGTIHINSSPGKGCHTAISFPFPD